MYWYLFLASFHVLLIFSVVLDIKSSFWEQTELPWYNLTTGSISIITQTIIGKRAHWLVEDYVIPARGDYNIEALIFKMATIILLMQAQYSLRLRRMIARYQHTSVEKLATFRFKYKCEIEYE